MSRIAAFVAALPPWWSLPRRPRSAATCTPPKYPGLGLLHVAEGRPRSRCATGKSVALAFHKCRTKTGDQGPLRLEGPRLLVP